MLGRRGFGGGGGGLWRGQVESSLLPLDLVGLPLNTVHPKKGPFSGHWGTTSAEMMLAGLWCT